MPHLMSAENPNGAKLEVLARELIAEVQAKSEKIKDDASRAAAIVRRNNNEIIEHLEAIANRTEHSMNVLAEIRADEGPRGRPRIGPGSEEPAKAPEAAVPAAPVPVDDGEDKPASRPFRG